MSALSILLDTIARPRCIECEEPLSSGDGTFCRDCDRNLPLWRRADGCPRCGTPSIMHPRAERDSLESTTWGTVYVGRSSEGCAGCFSTGSALHLCRSLSRYEGSLRRWIPGFKSAHHSFGPSIAIRRAIDHLSDRLASHVARETATRPDLVSSIPLHPRRRRRRRFNHGDAIAQRFAGALHRPFHPAILERRFDTPPQAKLVGRERVENVRGAFRATPRLGSVRSVWLVDDVLTTGSTLEAAADALLEAGVLEVRAFTLAATLPTSRISRASQSNSAYHAAPLESRYEESARNRARLDLIRHSGVPHVVSSSAPLVVHSSRPDRDDPVDGPSLPADRELGRGRDRR